MKTKQQAAKEEKQRIKDLVLNYDLQQHEDQDGNHQRRVFAAFSDWLTKFAAESDRILASHHIRVDRPNKDRSQRVRKLQLSDVDW